MSKVQESIRVEYKVERVKHAIRNVAIKTASPISETGNIFTVKLKSQLSLLNSPIPASVTMELKPSKKVEGATVIKFTSANIGIGPLQVRECQKKLDRMKELLLTELESIDQSTSKPPK